MLNVKHGSVLCKFGNSTYCLIFYNDLIQTDSHIPEEAGFVMQGLLRVLRFRIPSPSERSRWAGLESLVEANNSQQGNNPGMLCLLLPDDKQSFSLPTSLPPHLAGAFLFSCCANSFAFQLRAMSLEGHLWAHSTTHTLTVCLRHQPRPMSQDSDLCHASFKIAHSLSAHPSLSSLILCPCTIFSFQRACIIFVGRASREKPVHFRVSLMQKP